MRWTNEDTPEQQEFRVGFRSWLHDNLPSGWMEAADTGDDETLETLKADRGFNPFTWQGTIGRSPYAAPLWPKEYGGLSGEVWMQTVIRSELVHYRLPTVSVNLLGVGLAGPTLIAHGTDKQKERYLRKILSAEEIWCQLFSEPGSGSDLASLSTRAVRDGDEWVVNGQKVWTTIAEFATFGMLLARTDPDVPKHDGLSYFILEMKAPGVDIRPLKQMTGSSEFNEVFLSDVHIPDANRVGDVGDGWRCARTTLMNERVSRWRGSRSTRCRSREVSGAIRGSRTSTGSPTAPTARVRQRLAQFYIESEVKEITAQPRGELGALCAASSPAPRELSSKVFNASSNQPALELRGDADGIAARPVARTTPRPRRGRDLLRPGRHDRKGGTSEVLRNQMAERILARPVTWKWTRTSPAVRERS